MRSDPKRADFPPKVVAKLAQRAAYRCSFPDCDKTTIGPGPDEGQSVIVGVAAHIYSAAEGGPRGTGGLSYEQRQQIRNGIWLCETHASRIDKNDGIDFPAPLLQTYKSLHETKIAHERDGVSVRAGWLHSLVVERGPIFRPGTEILFGKVTALVGGNGSGKTAICRWLEATIDPAIACEWSQRSALTYEITFLNPAIHRLRLHVPSTENIAYFIDGKPLPLPGHFFNIIRLRNVRPNEHTTDLEYLSKTLNVHPALVHNMLPLASGQRGGTVAGLSIDTDEEGRIYVRTDVEGSRRGLSLQQLSTSERARVLIELAVVLARRAAESEPTVLILDWPAKTLDASWLRRMVSLLSEPENSFQTIIERLDTDDGIRNLARVERFVGKEEDVFVA